AHYSLAERTRVQTVTMDMNAAYQTIIHEVFPKAQTYRREFGSVPYHSTCGSCP
ncbi:transposase, partial [Lacticaseibacillus paracasei]